MYVPELRTKPISVGQVQRNGVGLSFTSNSNSVVVSKNGSVFIEGTTTTYNIAEISNVSAVRQRHAYISTGPIMRLLNKRLGHVNCGTITQIIKQDVVDVLHKVKSQNVLHDICGECKSGKANATPHKPQQHTYNCDVRDLIHEDLVGPVTPVSIGGALYTLVVLDDVREGSWVGFLKKKSNCPSSLKHIVMTIKNRTKKRF